MRLLISIVCVVVVPVAVLLVVRHNVYRKLRFMIDALEDNELNFRYPENSIFSRTLNRTLNRIRGIFERERRLMSGQEVYFRNMLDHVNTGIIAMRYDGKIEFMNSRAEELIQVGSISGVRQLRNINPSLYEALTDIRDGQNLKVEYYNECSLRTLLISSSSALLDNVRLKIVALNDFSAQLNENEDKSWGKLTRVMTHEIMNSITPIASLSETLIACVDDKDDNLTAGLDTIASSSRNLIKFVESYRNLTRIPQHVRKTFQLKDLVDRVFKLTEEMNADGRVAMRYIGLSDDIILYADESQIMQILVNLLKNAIQAGTQVITVSAEIDLDGRVVVDVANNGAKIEKQDSDELFVPFYSTKPGGTGIGLSISRQIMRMHGGTLSLTKSDTKQTVFTLIFP